MPWVAIPAPNPVPAEPADKDMSQPGPHTAPNDRTRVQVWYTTTVTPKAGAASTDVEESCNQCGQHVHTPSPATPPSVSATDTASGNSVSASGEYQVDANGKVTGASRWHAAANTRGYRTGKRFPGGTETVTAIRRTRQETQKASGWAPKDNPRETWEKEVKDIPIPSYIMWNAPVVNPCNINELMGVTVPPGWMDLLTHVLIAMGPVG